MHWNILCTDSSPRSFSELPLALAAGSEVAADAAYTYYEWEDALEESDGAHLVVGRKTNSRRREMPVVHDYNYGCSAGLRPPLAK